MDTNIITAALNNLVVALAAKGYHNVNAELILKDSDSYCPMRIEIGYHLEGQPRDYIAIRHRDLAGPDDISPSIEDMVRALRQKVDEMPSAKEARMANLVRQIEDVRGVAEDLGLDPNFVNPLTEMLARMASTALPAPK